MWSFKYPKDQKPHLFYISTCYWILTIRVTHQLTLKAQGLVFEIRNQEELTECNKFCYHQTSPIFTLWAEKNNCCNLNAKTCICKKSFIYKISCFVLIAWFFWDGGPGGEGTEIREGGSHILCQFMFFQNKYHVFLINDISELCKQIASSKFIGSTAVLRSIL